MEVKLEAGGTTLVSPEDLIVLVGTSWYATSQGYIRTTVRRPERKTLHLHRVVMARMIGRELTESEEVDHINRNPSDNQRSNLRIADRSLNQANRGYVNRSGFRGVYLPTLRYQARLAIGSRVYHIGSFDTPEEAAWMWDQFALGLYGEFASLNFEYV